MKKGIALLIAGVMSASLAQPVLAEQSQETFESLLEQEFTEPEMEYWPEMRWWLAEGSHTDENLRNSVQEIYDAGFRAVEILTLTEESLDQSIYGWGSEEWYHDTKVILEKATELGMGVSFTSGPNWQPAIPEITPDMEAASQELGFCWEFVRAGERIEGQIEMPAGNEVITEQKLSRVIAAKVEGNYNYETGENNGSVTTYLSPDNMIDVTALATKTENGIELDWQAPDNGDYLVFVFWMEGTAQAATSSAETTYVVNHFNDAGAESMIHFWDSYMFTDEIQDLIDKNGSVDYFQDSLEITTNRGSYLYWTSELLEEFQERRGYDLSCYLPILIRENQNWREELNSPVFSLAEDEITSEKIRNDFSLTLSELYEEKYLTPIREWLNSHNVNLRTQVSYGQWLEQSTAVRAVDIPEMETLFFNDNVDAYRMQSGVAHLYGKNIISNEMGPLRSRAYHTSMQEYLHKINVGLISGTNRMIFHGYSSIAGPEESTSWPGYDGIGYAWSDRWGKRFPYWKDINEISAYIARLQKALRTGTQKVDVGIVNQSFWTPNFFGAVVGEEMTYWNDDTTLQDAGYTFEYFSPYVMTDEETFSYEDNCVSPNGPSYQALIVHQDSIPFESAKKLFEMAEEGLPIVILEGAGTNTTGYDGQDQEVTAIFEELKELSNVRMVSGKYQIVSALQELGVYARTSFETATPIVTLLRDNGEEKYLCAYNETMQDEETKVSFDGVVDIYEVDPWTGESTRVGLYDYQDGRTEFTISVHAEEFKLYVLHTNSEEKCHAINSNADIFMEDDGSLKMIAYDSGDYKAELSDGSEVEKNVSVYGDIALTNWDLTVESWKSGEKHEITEERNGYTTKEYYYDTEKEEISVELQKLVTWDKIEELGREVCGIGTYTTTFSLPEEWNEQNGALLDLDEFIGTAAVYVNGEKASPVDPSDPVIDITSLLVKGENELKIEITSILGNAMIAAGKTAIEPASNNFRGNTYRGGATKLIDYQQYGLRNAVIRPYICWEVGKE